MRVKRFLSVLVAVLALLASLVGAAHATSSQDPRAEREQVRRQRAQAAAQVNALRSDASTVRAALRDLQASVTGEEAAYADASRAAAQASALAEQARREAEAAAARQATLDAELHREAINLYIQGDNVDTGSTIGDTEPTNEVTRATLYRFSIGRSQDLLDRLRSATEDLERARATAASQAATAEAARQDAASRVGSVRAARDQQAAYAAQVESRLDRRLSEAAALAGLDSKLSAQIAAQEAALAAAVSGYSGGMAPSPGGPVSLTTVRGITVATSIAGQLQNLLSASDGAGLALSGSGYRSSATQAALRRQHGCPNPSSPPSACRPPTARPGTSMHERGLAIDFRSGGAMITSRNSAAYQWLSANASRYGLYNLPSEPWHWSTTGD